MKIGRKVGYIVNNSATDCPILLKFGRLVHYGPRMTGERAASSGTVALIVTFSRFFLLRLFVVFSSE